MKLFNNPTGIGQITECFRDSISVFVGTRPDVERRWLELGCILFSQYYDTVRWMGEELAKLPEFANVEIGLECPHRIARSAIPRQ